MAFTGKYEVESEENYDDFMKRIGEYILEIFFNESSWVRLMIKGSEASSYKVLRSMEIAQ